MLLSIDNVTDAMLQGSPRRMTIIDGVKEMSGGPNGNARAERMDHAMAYRGRPPRPRSRRSSPRSGKPATWRRAAGVGGGVDADGGA